MNHADLLRATVERLVRDALPLRQFNVTRVNSNGSVDLAYGDGDDVQGVPCASSYAARAPGDKVWVMRALAGNWEVIARSESPDPTPPTEETP